MTLMSAQSNGTNNTMQSKTSFHDSHSNVALQQNSQQNSISEKDNHDASLKQQRQQSSQGRRNIKNLRGSQQVITTRENVAALHQKAQMNQNQSAQNIDEVREPVVVQRTPTSASKNQGNFHSSSSQPTMISDKGQPQQTQQKPPRKPDEN